MSSCAAASKPEWQAGATAKLNLKPKAASSSADKSPQEQNGHPKQTTSSAGSPVKVPSSSNGHAAAESTNGSKLKLQLSDLAEQDLLQVGSCLVWSGMLCCPHGVAHMTSRTETMA